MSNYKLVPVEPTRDDLIQCLLATRGQSEGATADAILSMLADAPVVEQEPVGVIREAEQAGVAPYADIWPWLEPGTKLYAAPQLAEQQPSAGDSLASVPDEAFAVEFAAWWDEHGQFCRAGGGTYEKSFAFEAWRHLYPQLMNLQMAAEEQQPIIPNEHGKNRYGLDMSYFRNLFNRELNRPLVNFKPSELARVLARASRTADPKVMHETEFQIAEQKSAPDVAVLVEVLEKIAAWPDGGSRYGQKNIKAFASSTLDAHRKGVAHEQGQQ